MSAILRFITEPRLSGYFFAAALFLIYGLAPFAIYGLFDRNPFMLQLGVMASIAAAVVIAGFNVPVFDGLINDHRFRIKIDQARFQFVVWSGFSLFFIIAFITAPQIPLFSALSGTFSSEELSIQRGAFLKTREGWESSFGYISGIFSGTLLPLALAMLFLNRIQFRYAALGIFVFYTLTYLQKALFVQVVSPLMYLSSRRLIWNDFGFIVLILSSIGLLYLNTTLARGVQKQSEIESILEQRTQLQTEMETPHQPAADITTGKPAAGEIATGKPPAGEFTTPTYAGSKITTREPEAGEITTGISAKAENTRPPLQHLLPPNFFSASFRPASTTEYLIWRIVAVPAFTAADALLVFKEKFESRHFYGATSSLLSAVLNLDRVNYDAEVYAHEWGRTLIGRSNSVFITDGHVNFGWIGVIVFSALVGLGFRTLSKSSNEAIRSMWPLFAYNIMQASLIGTLLSAGFALLFIIAIFVKFTDASRIKNQEGVALQFSMRIGRS